MTSVLKALVVAAALVVPATSVHAAPSRRMDLVVRGKTVSLMVYTPIDGATPKGTVLMASGDVGWVGLATNLAGFLSDQGWVVVGINTRQYLSVFVNDKDHLTVEQIPADYRTVANAMKAQGPLRSPVVVSGVSEGAALAVAAAAGSANRDWLHGVMTFGLPAVAELAWRWRDMASWITKSDANEPSFSPHEIIGSVSPLPIWMLQSTRDEYVPEADYRRFERTARDPKRLVLIDAQNHRFTDKLPQLKEQVLAGLAWIAAGGRP